MNVQQFINDHINRAWDFDGYYGAQCVDLVQFFAQWLGTARFTGNAINLFNQPGTDYIQIRNTPDFVPQAGDIACFDARFGNGYGHTSVCTGVGNKDWFESLDQNWRYPAAHIVRHNYTGVIGVLRPKKLHTGTAPAPQPAVKTVTVNIPNLQVRAGAGTAYAGGQANTPDGMLHNGMVVQVAAQVTGGWYQIGGVANDQWYKSVQGHYFAAGGCR